MISACQVWLRTYKRTTYLQPIAETFEKGNFKYGLFLHYQQRLCVCVCVCMRVFACVHACMYTCVHVGVVCVGVVAVRGCGNVYVWVCCVCVCGGGSAVYMCACVCVCLGRLIIHHNHSSSVHYYYQYCHHHYAYDLTWTLGSGPFFGSCSHGLPCSFSITLSLHLGSPSAFLYELVSIMPDAVVGRWPWPWPFATSFWPMQHRADALICVTV